MTFTRRAARELTSRLDALVGPAAEKLVAGTFHHFALGLLREHPEAAGVPPDFGIADEPRQIRTLQRAWNRLDISSREAEAKELRALLEGAA